MIDYGVERDGGLARLTVADNQLALAAADGEHRVDGEDARLHRTGNALPLDDAGRGTFDGAVPIRADIAETVDGDAEGVDRATQKRVAHGHARRPSGAAHRGAGRNRRFVVKEDAAHALLAQILHHAAHAAVKEQNLAVRRVRKAGHLRDAVAHGEHCADLLRERFWRPVAHHVFEQRDDVALCAERALQIVLELAESPLGGVVVDLLADSKTEPALGLVGFFPAQQDVFAVFLR